MLSLITEIFDFEFVEAIGDVFAELFEEVLHRDECIPVPSLLFLLSLIGSSYSHIHRKSICKVRQLLILCFIFNGWNIKFKIHSIKAYIDILYLFIQNIWCRIQTGNLIFNPERFFEDRRCCQNGKRGDQKLTRSLSSFEK